MQEEKSTKNGQREETAEEVVATAADTDATSDGESAEEETATEGGGELTLEEKLEKAETEAAEYLEGWQRARAEFANARKRLERQRIDARRNATIEVVSKLLPVLDDFDRALENVPGEIAEHDWFEGVALVNRKLRSILETLGIERIEAVGQPFDPNFHEAVLREESDEYESGIVTKELQRGYRLEDRVIRPSMVVVAA